MIGGLATNTYVRPVYTLDADLVIATHQLPETRAGLKNFGFKIDEETWSLNARQPGSELRVQFTKDPRYQDFLASAQPAQVFGCPAPATSLDNLIRGKSLAWSDPKRRLSNGKRMRPISKQFRFLRLMPAGNLRRGELKPSMGKITLAAPPNDTSVSVSATSVRYAFKASAAPPSARPGSDTSRRHFLLTPLVAQMQPEYDVRPR